MMANFLVLAPALLAGSRTPQLKSLQHVRIQMAVSRQPQYVTEAQDKLKLEGDGPAGDLATQLSSLGVSEWRAVSKPWVETYSAKPQLLVGDVLGLIAFAALGRASHGESPFNPIGDLLTAFPFLCAYLAAAKPLGAFEDEAVSGYRQMLHSLGPTWAATTLGGVALRAIGKLSAPPLPFVVVSAISTFIFLAGPRAFQVWRETGKLPDPNDF
jgi:hypothetical protein